MHIIILPILFYLCIKIVRSVLTTMGQFCSDFIPFIPVQGISCKCSLCTLQSPNFYFYQLKTYNATMSENYLSFLCKGWRLAALWIKSCLIAAHGLPTALQARLSKVLRALRAREIKAKIFKTKTWQLIKLVWLYLRDVMSV